MDICIVASTFSVLVEDDEWVYEFRKLINQIQGENRSLTIFVLVATKMDAVDGMVAHRLGDRDGIEFVNPDMDLGFSVIYANLFPSYAVSLILQERSYDLVYFFKDISLGFYSTLAKLQDLSFQDTRLIAVISSPTRYAKQMATMWIDHPQVLEIDYMEQKTVAYADEVIFLKDDVRLWMQSEGWLSEREKIITQWPIASRPLVSVCITHFNRPILLEQALSSVMSQTYDNIEVIVVDDGSTDESVAGYLKYIESKPHRFPLKVIHRVNGYLGAARNSGMAQATGEYIIFIDDDDIAKPNMVSVLVKTAERLNSDIVTSFMDRFQGDGVPDKETRPLLRWIFLGGCASVGLFYNCFGGANALIRLTVLQKLGGYTEDYGVGHEDWELYAKATLQGYRVDVCPEVTYWYRVTQESMAGITNMYKNYARSMRPYLSAVSSDLSPLFALAFGNYMKSENLTRACNQLLLQMQEKDHLLEQFRGMSEHLVQQTTDISNRINDLIAERDQLLERIKTLTNV